MEGKQPFDSKHDNGDSPTSNIEELSSIEQMKEVHNMQREEVMAGESNTDSQSQQLLVRENNVSEQTLSTEPGDETGGKDSKENPEDIRDISEAKENYHWTEHIEEQEESQEHREEGSSVLNLQQSIGTHGLGHSPVMHGAILKIASTWGILF